jgi:hypothetical protein
LPDQDPVRATFVAILRQLNQAESRHEGASTEQALELKELESRLDDFWAVRGGTIRVRFAVGLLLRNKLVQVLGATDYSWQRQRDVAIRYQITAQGKQFLVEAIENSDRVGGATPSPRKSS